MFSNVEGASIQTTRIGCCQVHRISKGSAGRGRAI